MATDSTASETTLDVREIDGPPFLFPELDDRGYAYESVEGDEASDDSEGEVPRAIGRSPMTGS